MTTDTDLRDAQHRYVSTLRGLALEKPGEAPTNRATAVRSGWICKGSRRPNLSKTKRIAAELEALGVLRRTLEDDGRQVRRTSIVLNLEGAEPPAQIRPTTPGSELCHRPEPVEHWVDALRFRVMTQLKAVASEGEAILPDRLARVATMVQAELAGSHQGNASGLFLKFVEAVAFGYDLATIEAAITSAAEGRCPRCRADIRHAVLRMHPDPRDFLQARGRTEWPPRATESMWR
jgi:hypothetical protein